MMRISVETSIYKKYDNKKHELKTILCPIQRNVGLTKRQNIGYIPHLHLRFLPSIQLHPLRKMVSLPALPHILMDLPRHRHIPHFYPSTV